MTEGELQVHRALSARSRVRLLRALQDADRRLDARELAEQSGLHLSTVRAHLDVLVDAGLAASEQETRTTPGRPRVLYRALSDAGEPLPGAGERPPANGDGEERSGYKLLAEVLVGHLATSGADPAGDAQSAGHVWGRYLIDGPPPFVQLTPDEARAKVMELFAALGFQPELDVGDDGQRILLRRCPFLDLAKRHPDVVCALHLGLLQGALDTLGAPLDAHRIDALVEPSLCIVHLNGHRR